MISKQKTIITALGLLLILASCIAAPTRESGKESLVIGIDFPLTGSLSIYGQSLLEGIQLAVDELANQNNSKSINLRIEDNEGSPAKAALVAQKLIQEENIHIILSTMVGPVGAIAPITESNKKVLLYAAAANNFAEQNKYVFKDSVDAYYDCKILGKYAEQHNLNRVALFGADAEFTLKCKQAIEEQKNLTLQLYEKYVKGVDTDYITQLTKIKAKNPDVVFLSAYADDCLLIWKKIKEIGLTTPFLVPFSQSGCGDEQSTKLIGNLPNSIIGEQFVINKQSNEFQTFITKFHQKYKKEPTILFFTALGYDWIHYITPAHEKCTSANQVSVNSDCLRSALEKTNYTGAWGNVIFQSTHASFRPRELTQYQNGSWIKI